MCEAPRPGFSFLCTTTEGDGLASGLGGQVWGPAYLLGFLTLEAVGSVWNSKPRCCGRCRTGAGPAAPVQPADLKSLAAQPSLAGLGSEGPEQERNDTVFPLQKNPEGHCESADFNQARFQCTFTLAGKNPSNCSLSDCSCTRRPGLPPGSPREPLTVRRRALGRRRELPHLSSRASPLGPGGSQPSRGRPPSCRHS